MFATAENQKNISGFARLREAFYDETVLEARAVRCDRDHNLHIDLGDVCGFMPREECALGLAEGAVRDIAVISRVNKPVCFKILGFHDDENGVRTAILSRRAVQADCRAHYLQHLRPGDVIDAVVTRLEPFGAFCDVGAGLPALLPIDSISVSRIPHPSARFFVGQRIRAILKSKDTAGRITNTQGTARYVGRKRRAVFRRGNRIGGGAFRGKIRDICGACAQSCRACGICTERIGRANGKCFYQKHQSVAVKNQADFG